MSAKRQAHQIAERAARCTKSASGFCTSSKGLAQAGLPLPLGREHNLQIRTNFKASHCPACAKPKLGVRHCTFALSIFISILLSKVFCLPFIFKYYFYIFASSQIVLIFFLSNKENSSMYLSSLRMFKHICSICK